MTPDVDVVVIGGGRSGLAAGHHLRRLGVDFAILDARATSGGAWRHTWDALRPYGRPATPDG
ncbi:FAD-dependent oxidoreductase [Streptomyces sp. NPDC059499]|uniref:FAD-dependent oxidoreductase n=1 Tax=Streptomyces sp. NPDC059499 TaxID=3346852 RepID=UPI003696E5B8